MKNLSIVLFVFLAASAAFSAEARTVSVKGVTRHYLLHIPPGKLGGSVPLVIVLHGGGGSGRSMERYSRFDSVADREGFLVAYPEGVDRHWNDGRQALANGADDVGFIAALIEDVVRKFHVDPVRVYATGISNGGMMSNRLACELNAKIAAVALVGSSGGAEIMKTCRPDKPVGYLLIDGTADPIVPYSGGEVRIMSGRSRGEVIGADATIQFWAKANGCKQQSVRALPDRAHDGTLVSVREYGGCTKPVVLYTISGGGHTWPSGRPYLPAAIIGKTSRQIDATEVIWEFFHSLAR